MTGEKTEEPTDQKLKDAAEKGQLPQRKNVLEAFLLTMGVITVSSLWKLFAQKITAVFDQSFNGITLGFDQAFEGAKAAAVKVISLGVIISVVFGVVILMLNLLLNKFNFAPGALKIKFEKLNPISGLKGIFSVNTIYSFIRLLIYFFGVSVILYFMIRNNIKDVINAASCGLGCLAGIFPPIILTMVILILLLLLIMAVFDFHLQTKMFRKQNKMTKDEIKREHKGAEGDPLIKGKRREISEENVTMPSAKDVTHVIYSPAALVAVLYEPGSTPFVVMKAQGGTVARLQQRFRRMGVKCVNIPSVAIEFHKRYPVGVYMDAKAAASMAKVLQATGEAT